MAFVKGRSGNPRGKPRGARHRATIAAESMLDGESEALTRKAIELALEGDGMALRLCLERILPARKDRPLRFTLPPLKSAEDAAAGLSAILEAVASGDLTPGEACDISRLLESFGKMLEGSEIEKRIAALEAAAALDKAH